MTSSLHSVLRGLALAALALAACGGPQIATHNGYKTKSKPWEKAKPLVFEEDEAEADGELDYAARRRARWFAVDLPFAGEIQVSLSASPLIERSEMDVAFEVLDAGYNVLVRADAEEEDAGEQKKERMVYELEAGRYYVHVYLQGRADRADYGIKVKYTRAAPEEVVSDFPSNVAFVEALPVVPLFDDAPPPDPCKSPDKEIRKKKCKRGGGGGGGGHVKPPPPDDDDDTPVSTELPKGGVSARITNLVNAGAGTRVTVNRGAAQNIAVGMRGILLNDKGKAIPNGSFKIEKVASNESSGIVSLTRDQAAAAKSVLIKP